MNNLPSPFQRFRHIVIEGPIGVGKTTLTKKIATLFNAQKVLEDPAANPFIERFYRDGPRYALPTQLFFLFQRINQLRDLSQRDLFSENVIGDFLLDKDPIFARLTLADDELKLYEQIYESLKPQAPIPDLVVYLQADADTLINRVNKRGIEMEEHMSDQYLRALSENYSRFFYHYDQAPILIINTEHLNPVDNDEDFALFLKQLTEMRGKRVFFNRA
jgi:deoxyguanosine kinase